MCCTLKITSRRLRHLQGFQVTAEVWQQWAILGFFLHILWPSFPETWAVCRQRWEMAAESQGATHRPGHDLHACSANPSEWVWSMGLSEFSEVWKKDVEPVTKGQWSSGSWMEGRLSRVSLGGGPASLAHPPTRHPWEKWTGATGTHQGLSASQMGKLRQGSQPGSWSTCLLQSL